MGTEGVTNDVRLGNAEMIEQANDVQRHLAPVSGRVMWLVTLAMTAQVEADDPVVACQVLSDSAGGPDLQPIAESVDQDDGLTLSLLDIVEPDPARVENLILSGTGSRWKQGRESKDYRQRPEHDLLPGLEGRIKYSAT